MSEVRSLIQELEDAMAAGSPAMRLNTLTRITDLFLSGSGQHSDEHLALFDDVLLVLIETIEVNARAQLASRLARLSDSPPKVTRTLAFDPAIAVAAPILMHSERLSDRDLIENAGTMSQAHLRAMTQRRSLSEPVTDALLAHGDDRVFQLVAQNAGARFSEDGFGKLVGKAAQDESLARYVGSRHDLPRHHFLKLLETASAAVRERLIAANPKFADVIQTTVADVASAISDEVRSTSREHNRAMTRIKRLHRTGQFNEAELHAYASANDFERAAIALAALGEFPMDIVERAMIDKSTDLILVLVRAAKCCRATARALLTMRVADRRLSPMDIASALAQFDRLQLSTARSAIEFYQLRRQSDDKPHVPADLSLEWYAEALPPRPGAIGR